MINPETTTSSQSSKSYIKNCFTVTKDVQINSLLATENFLVVGTVGEILGYTWKNIRTADCKPTWKIDLPNIKDSFDKTDVNTLIHNKELEHIYAGCGDSNIYTFDFETRKLIQTFKGHTDYIHSIHYW